MVNLIEKTDCLPSSAIALQQLFLALGANSHLNQSPMTGADFSILLWLTPVNFTVANARLYYFSLGEPLLTIGVDKDLKPN